MAKSQRSDEFFEDAYTAAISGEVADAQPAPGQDAKLAVRYGYNKRRFADKVVLVIGGSALVAVLSFFMLSLLSNQSVTSVSVQTRGFEIVDAQQTSLSFTVKTAQPHTPLLCAVEALSSSHAVVGYKLVKVPASAGLEQTVTTTVRTTVPAVAVSAKTCWVSH